MTRWRASAIINAPQTDGEALHAPPQEMDAIPDIHSDVNYKLVKLSVRTPEPLI